MSLFGTMKLILAQDGQNISEKFSQTAAHQSLNLFFFSNQYGTKRKTSYYPTVPVRTKAL